MTDAELAADYRKQLRPKMDEIAIIVDKARLDGLEVNFQIGPNPDRTIIAGPIIIKRNL